MAQSEVIFDTTCPLYFTVTGHEGLLAERYAGCCYLPEEVINEIQVGEAAHGYNCERLLRGSWWRPLAITELEDQRLFLETLQRWGSEERNRGEAAALVLARRRGSVAVVDDLQARRAAQSMGVSIIGTVGILARIVAEGRLDDAAGWGVHREMVDAGFRSPLRSASDFGQLVERLRRGD